MQRDQGEDQCFEVLHKVVEYTQSFRICRFRNIYQRANLCSLPERSSMEEGSRAMLRTTHLKGDVLIAQPDLKFLFSVFVFLWPFGIVFFHDLAVLDDFLDLRYHQGADAHYLSQ
jgi:hypothetical protein